MGNSVIYTKPYDAEVEYLESTGTQWIDTGIVSQNNLVYDFCLTETHVNDQKSFFGFIEGSEWRSQGENLANWCASHIRPVFAANDFYIDSTIPNSSYLCHFDFTDGNAMYSINDETKWNSSLIGNYDGSRHIFIFWIDALENLQYKNNYARIGIGRIHFFKISKNGQLLFDGIPVRIGSVGYLYDKVSKQLFANKGTGNFILGNDVSNAIIPQQRCVLYFGSQRSVVYERIYEEYEWLIGDGSAYIDTLVSDLTDIDIVICYFSAKGVLVDNRIFGREMSGSWFTVGVDMNNNSRLSVWLGNSLQYPSINTNEDFIEIDLINNIARTSLQSYNFYAPAAIGRTFYLFGNNGYNIPFAGKIKQFSIGNILNLIPCKLLRSIPSYMDGNGIARQAGECGMWDKVSNRFYGNVASSGTFTVKGAKCYEEYEWLKAICPVNTSMMTLSIGSQNFNLKVKVEQIGNITYFRSDNYSYHTASARIVNIWDIPNAVSIFSAQTAITDGMTVDISSTSESLTFNGEIIPKYEFPNIRFQIRNAGNAAIDAITYTSSITVDGSVRYVPCKLTHGIPASMDANGIARPAGTCGMWDKVNDVFYGNVASSGSFTVSND